MMGSASTHDRGAGDTDMEHGRLIEMGRVTTVDAEGAKTEYKMALVIEFASTDEIRQAIKDEKCTFGWGNDGADDYDARAHQAAYP
jgi:hypothetical protein